MKDREKTIPDTISFADLKPLAEADRCCITIVTTIPNPSETSVRLKNALRSVQKQLTERGEEPSVISSLLEPIQQLTMSPEVGRMWSNALVIFRSDNIFRYYVLRDKLDETAAVADSFYVMPLLNALAREQRFHLLALSQQSVRLFHCTQGSAEEVSFQGLAYVNMRDWMNTRQPSFSLDNHATGGPSVGSMRGVMFSSGTGSENEDEHLRHFLGQVDKGVSSLLRGDLAPLLLAGVEYEVAVYRRVNTYPHLSKQAVLGSPDGVPLKTLHERAWAVMNRALSESLQKALADFRNNRNLGRVTFQPKEALKAAGEGRVADLFVRRAGDEGTALNKRGGASVQNAGYEHLLNATALQTLKHGGRAFQLTGADMPEQQHIAAVLRF